MLTSAKSKLCFLPLCKYLLNKTKQKNCCENRSVLGCQSGKSPLCDLSCEHTRLSFPRAAFRFYSEKVEHLILKREVPVSLLSESHLYLCQDLFQQCAIEITHVYHALLLFI